MSDFVIFFWKEEYTLHRIRASVRINGKDWIKGYEPEIFYQKEFGRQVLSIDEAMTSFPWMFGKAATENGVELRTLLADYASGGSLVVMKSSRTHTSMIRAKKTIERTLR